MLIIIGLIVVGVVIWYIYDYADRDVPRELADMSVLPEQFVVFDLETTGLDAGRHEIIEIGAVRVSRDSDTHDTFQNLVIPTKKIPKKITQLTGITQHMVDSDGERLDEIIPEVPVIGSTGPSPNPAHLVFLH